MERRARIGTGEKELRERRKKVFERKREWREGQERVWREGGSLLEAKEVAAEAASVAALEAAGWWRPL